MIKISIKNRFTDSIIFEYEKENNTISDTVKEYVKKELEKGNYRADLSGANLSGKKIKKCAVFSGLYTYIVIAYITEENEKFIKMGCHNRILSDWESDFWNNDNEFPNNNSEKSNMRLMAFETAKKWFEIIEKSK